MKKLSQRALGLVLIRILNIKYQISNIFYFLFLIFNFHCKSAKPESFGKLREIVVLTDYKKNIISTIEPILKRPVWTPQPEPEYLIRYEPLARFSAFLKFSMIFIVGTLKEEPLKDLLKEKAALIERDTFALFVLNEPWAKEQYVLIFIAKEERFLEAGVLKYAKRIKKSFDDYFQGQMFKITYERGYQKKLSDDLFKKYRFRLDLPFGFTIIEEQAINNFIYFVAHNPDRNIFVYWEDGEKPLEAKGLLSFRDSLTARFYDGDFVLPELCQIDTVQFPLTAIRIQGVWQNEKDSINIIGGPFVSYCFNYQGKFYFLDGLVYNPGKEKLNNLNQLKAIISTFRLQEE